jgi:hypothetical protein
MWHVGREIVKEFMEREKKSQDPNLELAYKFDTILNHHFFLSFFEFLVVLCLELL